MGIIFLDWDGVIKTSAYETVDDESVKNFNYIIESTGAKVVISSTRKVLGIEYFKRLFRNNGIKGTIIDTLTTLAIETRGKKVDDFLKQKRYKNAAFVIIDNHSHYTEAQKAHKLIKIDSKVGITLPNAERAISILNGWK